MRLEQGGDVLSVYIDREEKANTITIELIKEMISLADWLRESEEIKYVIFTNNGRFFSAGYNLYDLYKDVKDVEDQHNLRLMQVLGQEMINKLENLEQVTFSAIRGSAYGGGVAIALTADFRIMADHTVLGLPETNIGMFLSWGCTPRLVRLVGATKAKELILFGGEITAEESCRLGIVNKVCPVNEVDSEVHQMISKLRTKGQQAISITKKLINASVSPNFGDILLTEPDLTKPIVYAGEITEKVEDFLARKGKRG